MSTRSATQFFSSLNGAGFSGGITGQAPMAGRKLKVFQAQFGFYDTIVAASSQPAALRAWGVRQNLFAEGLAHVVEDAEIVAAALAHPEIPLRRAVGSSDPFELQPANLPDVPASKNGPKTRAKPEKPPADRSKLDKAEITLRNLDAEHKAEEAAFRRRQDELEAAQEAAQSDYVAKRRVATAELVEARAAYRKAGGDG